MYLFKIIKGVSDGRWRKGGLRALTVPSSSFSSLAITGLLIVGNTSCPFENQNHQKSLSGLQFMADVVCKYFQSLLMI